MKSNSTKEEESLYFNRFIPKKGDNGTRAPGGWGLQELKENTILIPGPLSTPFASYTNILLVAKFFLLHFTR